MPEHVVMEGHAPAGEPVDPGTYDARIIDANEDVSKQNNQMIVLDIQIESAGPFFGTPLRHYLTFTSKTERFWKRDLIALGWDEFPERGEPFDLEAEELVDRECRIVVVSNPYTDPETSETRPGHKVQRLLAPISLADAAASDRASVEGLF